MEWGYGKENDWVLTLLLPSSGINVEDEKYKSDLLTESQLTAQFLVCVCLNSEKFKKNSMHQIAPLSEIMTTQKCSCYFLNKIISTWLIRRWHPLGFHSRFFASPTSSPSNLRHKCRLFLPSSFLYSQAALKHMFHEQVKVNVVYINSVTLALLSYRLLFSSSR